MGATATRVGRARRVWSLLPLWSRREVRVQYRQSALDLGWSLITPVLTLVGYGIVLTRAFGVDGDGVPYLTFAWSGVVLWTFISGALTRGSLALVAAADLVRKAPFPREVVPIAAVVASCLDLGVGLLALVVLMVVQHVSLSITAVAAVPVALSMVIWVTAMAIILATATAFVRDVAHGLAVILRIGIFVTPVMYPVSQVPQQYRWALAVNPAAVSISSFRECVLRGNWPPWGLLGVHTVAAVALLGIALWYSKRVEGRLADVI